MNKLYIEPFSGLSGDMFLGALCELADGFNEISRLPENLGLADGKVEIREANKNGIVCKHVKIHDLAKGDHSHHHHAHDHGSEHHHHHHHEHHDHSHGHDHSHSHNHDHEHQHHDHSHEHTHGHAHVHRHLSDINEIIDKGNISDNAKNIAREIFQIIGKSESTIHNIPLEKIHFHEVSAVDSILDIIGCAVMLDKLQVNKAYADPVCTGYGMVKTQHGMLPIPAPATADILKGMPVYKGNEEGEKITPTGAAILRYLNPDFRPPLMKKHKIAYGPGEKDFKSPNVVRISLVESVGTSNGEEKMYVVESNIDDSTGEFLGSAFQNHLMEAGARDFYFTSVQMKKGRPGIKLTALVSSENLKKVNNFILEHTSTIGVRYYPVARDILPRENVEIDTKFGKLKAKEVTKPSGWKQQKIEYDALEELSKKHNINIQQIKTELFNLNAVSQ